MLYAQLTEADRQTLQAKLKEAKETSWYRRLKVVDLSAQGQSVPDLAELFELSEATVRDYIHRYHQGGLSGLQPDYGRGRPPMIDWTAEQWLDILAQSPASLPLLETVAQNWSQKLLVTYLRRYHQITVTQSTVSKSLRSVGIRWRRAKLRVHSPDPLYVVKRQRWRAH